MKRLLRGLALLCCMLSTQAFGQIQPVMLGDAVVTSGATQPGDPVVTLIKVQDASSRPLNANWGAPRFSHQDWSGHNLGQVFGAALDGAGNIYVTATSIYPIDMTGFGGPGAVYRLDAVTNEVTLFAGLPNNGAGLGNICWDPDHNPPGSTNGQFFVTNFEDGKIYQLNGSTGEVIATYDPFAADNGTAGFAPRGERLWGIGYRKSTAAPSTSWLYFARWQEDMGHPSGLVANQIYSVQLDADGKIAPATQQLALTLSSLPGKNWSNPPSDIEFSKDGRMLVAERGWDSDVEIPGDETAHNARLLEYVLSRAEWIPGNTFQIGHYPSPSGAAITTNSAGGADYGYGAYDAANLTPVDYDAKVWGSGNALHYSLDDYIHGAQMLPAAGGDVTSSVLVDLDGIVISPDRKNFTGDIDVFMSYQWFIPPCSLRSHTLTPVPTPTGGCCWHLNLVSNYPSWYGIQVQILTPGATFSSNSAPTGWSIFGGSTSIFFDAPGAFLGMGSFGPLQFCIDPGSTTSQTIVITWIGYNTVSGTPVYCTDTVTTNCSGKNPCAEIAGLNIECLTGPPSTPTYEMTFSVVNLSSNTYTSVGLTSNTPGTTVTTLPISFPFLPPNSASTPKTFTLVGGAPGSLVCFTITLYSAGKKETCTIDTCIRLPKCPDCCEFLNLTVKEKFKPIPHPNGMVTLSQWMTSAPSYLSRITATVVSATRSIRCNWSYTPPTPVAATFVYGLIGTLPPSSPYGTGELTWGNYTSGILLNNTSTLIRLQFPPLPPPGCRDTLRFCIKYTFTDTACLTCDTTVCYQVPRQSFWWWPSDPESNDRMPFGTEGDEGDNPGGTKEEERSLLSFGSSNKRVRIAMTSETAGTLTLENPALEADDDPNLAPTVVGLAMEPEVGIDLTQMSDNSGLQLATIADRVATINPLVSPIAPGSTGTFSLIYNNAIGATAFTNYLRIYYKVPEYGDEIFEAVVTVYARTPLGFGGDLLAIDEALELENVRTYGLRFENLNSTGDEIARVEITVADGSSDEIVAVGPGIDRSRADMKAFRTTGPAPRVLLLAEEPSEEDAGATPLEPNETVTPIYITVSGGLDDKVAFDYTTFNAANEVVSTGTVNADQPLLPGPAGVDDPSVPGVRVSAVECIPNPANQTATFSFTLPRAEASVWLVITDMAGTEIARIIDGRSMAAGSHELAFDVSKLASGTYLYTLRTKDQVQTRQMQIVR